MIMFVNKISHKTGQIYQNILEKKNHKMYIKMATKAYNNSYNSVHFTHIKLKFGVIPTICSIIT